MKTIKERNKLGDTMSNQHQLHYHSTVDMRHSTSFAPRFEGDKPACDTTPSVYCYIDRHGARKAVLADWENSTAEQRQEAAVKAGRISRRERLISAIRAVYHAGELHDNADLFRGALS